MIRFSQDLWAELQVIRKFLFTRMYRAPSVMVMRAEVTKVVEELFPFYMERNEFLPKDWQEDVARAKDETAMARLVADYIAGMTDRYAYQSHARFFGGAGNEERAWR